MPSKWVPLEANPEVFNAWSEPLGLPESLAFQDLYSLDPDFLQYTPQPVYAVLLLFPATGKLQEERKAEDTVESNRWVDGERGENDRVWWIKQTIGNACGSIGLLHALLNLPSHLLDPSSTLSAFKAQSLPLDKAARAKLLETTDFFTAAHTQAAQAGQSSVPTTQEEIDTDLHFLALVQGTAEDGSKHIVELDGNRNGPLDRGPCSDFLQDAARVVQDKYIDRSGGDVRLNMVVLAAKGDD